MFWRFCICTILVVFAGCASAPTQEEIQNADYGAEPTPAQFTSTIEASVKRLLKDPGSAQFQYPYPAKKGWFARPFGAGTLYGYWTCGLVNAKNSFGGYTGFDYFVVVYNNGRITHAAVASSNEDFDLTRAGCQNSVEFLSGPIQPTDVLINAST